MRVRDLAIAGVLAGCATNPDPRSRSIEHVVQDGHGAWIDVTLRGGGHQSGELIAVDGAGMKILILGPYLQVIQLAQTQVASAELWAYETEQNSWLTWGLLGTATTVSHGYFLMFSAPLWLLTTSIVAATESRGSLTKYPEEAKWLQLAIWARFPQGVPPGLPDDALIHQVRAPATHTVPPGLTPTAPTP